MAQYIEQYEAEVLYLGGLNTQKPMTISGTASLTVSGTGGIAISGSTGLALSSAAPLTVTGTGNVDLTGTTGLLKFPAGGPSTASSPAINGYFTTAIKTNGNTAVNLFGATAGFAGSLTSITILAQDDTNGKIEVFSDGGTIIQITKGSLGGVKGSVMSVGALASSGFVSGSTIKIISGTAFGAGNAIVIATFLTS